jgi:hypothetical protein
VEVSRRGTRGMDAERGAKGQGRPFVTAPGAAPERGNPGAAGAGCRARFLLGYFLFRASKEKVTRPGAETRSVSTLDNRPDHQGASPDQMPASPKLASPVSSNPVPMKCEEPFVGASTSAPSTYFLLAPMIDQELAPLGN